MKKKFRQFFARFHQLDFRSIPGRIPKSKPYRQVETLARRRPLTTFLIGLAILLGVIASGNFLNSLKEQSEEEQELIKTVQVYDLNGTPSMQVQARVDKSGVIQILSQSAGVVQNVNVTEGTTVRKGEILVTFSTNYQGGSAPALQYQLANAQYKNVTETHNTQREIIAKQRDVANTTEENAEELRKIARDSADDTRSLLQLNQDMLSTINTTLTNLENENVGGVNDQLIFQTRQQQSQVQSGVVQLQAQLRQLDYQKDADKPPAELGKLQKEITLKQLDVQEKALALSLESSRIQRDLAGIAASLMTPASPCAGTVERVLVKPGDTVSPGTPIAIIRTESTEVTLEALVPADIAAAVSQTSPSSISLNGSKIRVVPYYISREATSGSLYSVLYNLTDSQVVSIADGEYITVTIPIGHKLRGAVPYVPLDAVYQTQSEAYVFVISGRKAVSKKVTLGEVYGKFVTITQGLRESDRVILNRNVVAGETVTVEK